MCGQVTSSALPAIAYPCNTPRLPNSVEIYGKPCKTRAEQRRRWSIPTLASNSKLHFCNGLQIPEEASASESASEIITGIRLNHYSGITRQSLATTGFAARLV